MEIFRDRAKESEKVAAREGGKGNKKGCNESRSAGA